LPGVAAPRASPDQLLSTQGRAATIRYAGRGDVIGLPAALASGAGEIAAAVTDCYAFARGG